MRNRLVEAKAKEHHRGTREWVFNGVKVFVNTSDEGEYGCRCVRRGMGWGGIRYDTMRCDGMPSL